MKILKSALAATAAGILLAGGVQAGSQEDNLRKYSEGVSLLNLLNGLNLTDDQQKRILELNKELRTLRDGSLNSREAQALTADKEKAMGELYNYLLANPEKEDKAIQGRAAKAEHALKVYRDENFKKLGPEVARVVKEVEGMLSSQQLEVVENFLPCIVPPKDMRDPVRAGQAKSSDATVKALEQARRLSDAKKDVDGFAQRTADAVIAGSEKKAKLSDDERKDVRERVVAAIKQAVKLSDTDFEIQKPLLAQKLEIVNKIEDLRNEIDQRNPHANPLQTRSSKVRQFLVNPDAVIPALESRLKNQAPGGLKASAAPETQKASDAKPSVSKTWK